MDEKKFVGKVKEQIESMKQERVRKQVVALIHMWTTQIRNYLTELLDLTNNYELISHYKLSKNKVVCFMRDDINIRFEYYTKDIKDIHKLEQTKSILIKRCGSLKLADQIFENGSRIPKWWYIKPKDESLAYVYHHFDKMNSYIDGEGDESFELNRRKYNEAAKSLWMVCKDLGISYSVPDDK